MRVLLLALFFAAAGAAAQDYEREKRWAAEVVPNLVVGDAVQLKLSSGREFLGIYVENKAAKNAILLVHGIGVHPDHGVIGILRASLADLGYATLSIQMPVLRSDAATDEYFPALFPEAAARIQAGADWLAQKGYARPVLLSHSMGSWMSNVYFERMSDASFAAWVCLGRSGAFSRMGSAMVPVLDVYGEKDLPGVRRDDWRRRLTLEGIPGSKQVMIPATDHHYAGREKELAAVIGDFLAPLNATPAAGGRRDCPAIDPGAQQRQEKECRAGGGEWAKFGIRAHLCGTYSCAPRTADGGKPCRNRTECEYLCVARKPAALGTEVAGACAAVKTAFGCNYQVDGGRIIGYVCVD